MGREFTVRFSGSEELWDNWVIVEAGGEPVAYVPVGDDGSDEPSPEKLAQATKVAEIIAKALNETQS